MRELLPWARRLGDRTVGDIPTSLRRDIDRQQDESERLISWIQLGIVLSFAILYALSRKTTPVLSITTPSVIGIYFVLTVIRVVMTHRIRLTFWLLLGSIFFDIGLLFGLLWSFHIQYSQPPAFYLKAPTLLYLFIFIALRALRFEVRYVLITGLAAAIGWMLLAAYAIWYGASDHVITRDFEVYMTTNSVLIGAEFDKVISILMVTGILAMAVSRARRMLFHAATASYATANLSRFFDPNVAARIGRGADAEATLSGQTRDVAILMLDIRRYTEIAASLQPHVALQLLTEFRNKMRPIIEDHGGAIDKFLGDGIMATYGAVGDQPDRAARACLALRTALREADNWSQELQIRGWPALLICGAVSKGSVVCGAVGDQARLEYTVIGDAVNLVAKLEKQNKVLGTRGLITLIAYEAGQAEGMMATTTDRRIEKVQIDGLPQPIDLVAIA